MNYNMQNGIKRSNLFYLFIFYCNRQKNSTYREIYIIYLPSSEPSWQSFIPSPTLFRSMHLGKPQAHMCIPSGHSGKEIKCVNKKKRRNQRLRNLNVINFLFMKNNRRIYIVLS